MALTCCQKYDRLDENGQDVQSNLREKVSRSPQWICWFVILRPQAEESHETILYYEILRRRSALAQNDKSRLGSFKLHHYRAFHVLCREAGNRVDFLLRVMNLFA
jgi:hypothetical protein